MTSATVTQLGEMIANISGNAGNTETQTGEFAGIFQTAAGKSEGAGPQETVKTSVTERNMSVSKTADKLREQRTEEVSNEPKDMEVVEKELEAAAEELKEEIAEKLDITVEEVEAVMETLGLTDASLFTQEGMTALVMEVEQISTSIELLTNADAYQTLQDLNAVAGELLEQVQNENQLTDVEMKEVLEQFSKVKEVSQGVSADETDMQNITGETDEAENADTIEGKQPADSEADAETSTKDVNSVKDATTPNGKESEAGNKGNEQNTNHNQQVAAESNFQLNNTQTVNQTTTDFSQNITGGNLSTQEIYDQIGEFIKTNIRPGIAEVEMQLNPENLGTVSIHLSSKQGNVTAQFVVQNEAVKVALEMQMIQLKENFAEQGIKVDAVEVTVESHAFNQNMQQSNEENNQAQAEARKSSTRSINLNGDWTEEELTEEEQLVAEMMEADGNTVDFKA